MSRLKEREELLKRIPNRIDLAECVLSYRTENVSLAVQLQELREAAGEVVKQAERRSRFEDGRDIFEEVQRLRNLLSRAPKRTA